MGKRKWTDEQFIEAVKTSPSYAEVMKKIGLKPAGSNYDTVKRKISELGLDTSHMTGKVWNQGERYRPVKEAKPLEEILVEHSSYISTYHLKERLLKEGVSVVVIQSGWESPLHHVNGVKDDLRMENLQILCPNCHAFTDNYRGRNINK